MANRWCKPQSIEEIPKNLIDSAHEKLIEVCDIFKLKKNKFISMGPITIFQTDLEETIEQVKASSRGTPKSTKISDEHPEEIKATLDRLREEEKLTLQEIRKLERELRKKEIRHMEISQQIEHLEQQAKAFGEIRRKKKIKKRFDSNYERFISVLNDELLDLEPSDKKDTIILLNNMTEVIQDTVRKLSKQ